jgi:hypothetical protein
MLRPILRPVVRLTLAVAVGAVLSADTAAVRRSTPIRATQQPAAASQRTTVTPFSELVVRLSEPGGYFNTDNLISNERSYLHVIPELRALSAQAAKGGVYLGVGPDQNFSYIAHLRPSLAILVDIRRDNLLLHLLFKALFGEAATRAEYLALLTGRAPPGANSAASITELVRAVDAQAPLSEPQVRALRQRLTQIIRGFGLLISDQEHGTIDAFHRRFIAAGLSLQFNTTGRAPQPDYPTFRDLLLEADLTGAARSFLASERDFQFVKGMHAKDLIIPVTGDLAGPTALSGVARYMAETRRQLTAFYTSNVEFYLFRDASYSTFIANLGALPRQPGSLIIRGAFPAGGGSALRQPGYNSAQLTQPIADLLDGFSKGRYRRYDDLLASPRR